MLKLIHTLDSSLHAFKRCALTIGNFDGLHLGHKALIEHLIAKAHSLHLPSVLLTFEPQTNEFFALQNTLELPGRLTRLVEKYQVLKTWGLDYLVCLRFDNALAQCTRDAFIFDVLVKQLGTAYLQVGAGFRFGRKRAGDEDYLLRAAKKHGFTVEMMPTQFLENARISSTAIRLALKKGDLKKATQYLGRAPSLFGKVIRGEGRGHAIGVPTANLLLHRRAVPFSGVFAVIVTGVGAHPVQGVANLGTRPTVDGSRYLLEVHLFDYHETLYGSYMTVTFYQKIRSEQTFASLAALKMQIAADIQVAKDFFARG